MRDVARHAGVSPMTVSRTLRDDPQATPEAAARVMAAVDALGYQRNETARLLRLGQPSGVVGLIMTNLANPFYAELALGSRPRPANTARGSCSATPRATSRASASSCVTSRHGVSTASSWRPPAATTGTCIQRGWPGRHPPAHRGRAL